MYCTQCGAQFEEQATICSQCQASLFQPSPSTAPVTQASTIPNYLVQSILITVCCCLIPGIVAIVYAAQVNGLIQAGDFAGARRCSRLARNWSWAGLGLGLLGVLAYVALLFVGGMLAE